MKNAHVSTVTEESNASQNEGQMIAYLEDLLLRQLEKLRKYDLDKAVQIAEESQAISEQVAKQGLLDRPEYQAERKRIQGLYQDLCLVIASEREEVSEKLKQIREGIRALSKYGGK